MDLNKLKQEAEEYAEGMAKYYASTHEDCIPSQFEKYLRNAYISSAEPRERQITGLSKHILELQKDKGNLIDRCKELEKRCANYEMTISKMEKGTCDICKEIEKDKKIEELEAQIEKMKCCYNCSKWNEGLLLCNDSPVKIATYADYCCKDWKLKELEK